MNQQQRQRIVRQRIAWKAEEWAARYGLSGAEAAIFSALAQGTSRKRVMRDRRILEATLKRHIFNMLIKTGDVTVMHAIARMFREML